ncbi:response regulator [bacterium]|nr:response regulator [bacterium]
MAADKNIRILVVEDNDKIRDLIITILKNIGFQNISDANNGKTGWEILKKEKVDLVLTDLMMPEMDGLELLKKIRSDSTELKDVPVLMITASDKSDDVRLAVKWNISGYILKPFSVKTVLQKINDAFS